MAQARRKHAALRTAQRRTRRSAHNAPGWILFATGLGVGLFVALLVYLNVGGHTTVGSGFKNLFDHQRAAARDARAVRKPGAAALPKPAKPKFDFYTVLPEFESVLPEGATNSPPDNSAAPGPGKIRYILQAASYANFTDADTLRAKLALNNLDAQIEKVTIENRGDYYRVRLGPFDGLGELNRVNKRLVQLGVHAIRLRIREAK